MKTEEVIAEGRKAMRDVDVRLARAERVVEDTVQIGVQTAATLHEQSKQMDKIVDDLDEIEFTMKAAGRVVRDITRGIMTDRCIRCLLFLILVAIIVVVVLKVTDDDDDSFPKPKVFGGDGRAGSTQGDSGRRRLLFPT
ncbi:unnamed protein product [Ostreobium quekettii]|uniref:t-SNARE coiled-coil homology domain-containing protein n=1 Tax=Ostreobium quekettii TaxID=121088 RepID=A0A8S1IXB8_9CHLO|nr:unnamed protein product [Ostreobium quekettii]|eukprot:evm.model.scf_19.6 EVM.evm.TU.scf_19.6   scf_19:115695-118211(-)